MRAGIGFPFGMQAGLRQEKAGLTNGAPAPVAREGQGDPTSARMVLYFLVT